ncbi:MAG: PAS domain S-box protein [Sporocytophaga sp.]|uniref:PAS domain-containing protein n=1 Tax=Sporocytophaga sp. TaxID=2231183 RepID=UPI001B07214B|nr:PAS domain S-box protein [Sporocytophaga sp.]MBO9703613.1 PAS domain S-box protein [Sporocytophaga sp.]
MELLRKLFESNFMPHGHCYFWKPEIYLTNAISDSIIAIAYFTIPFSIVYIVKVRKDFKYYWLLILFAIFILGCGTTHVMDVINIWKPYYHLDSLFRVITALASIGTAIALIKYTPEIILIPNAEEFKGINIKLQEQILLLSQKEEQLRIAQIQLSKANEELEKKVNERTADLRNANEQLSKRSKDLEQSEGKLRTLADNIPNLVWIANKEGEILWYNNRWYEYTGKTPEEMEGSGWQSLHDPSVLPEVIEKWRNSISTGQPFEMTFPMKGKDGNYKQFLTRVVPLKNEMGEIENWFGTNTDITQEIIAQKTLEALAYSQRQFKSTFEQAAVGMAHVAENGKFLLLNQKYCELLGYSLNELINIPFEDITFHEDIHADLDLFRKLKAKEIPYYKIEKRYLKKDGEIIWVNLTASIVWNEKENFEYAVAIVDDITLRKQIEEMLIHSNIELKKINNDLDNFIYTASHDLKAPISNMEGLLHTIYDETKDLFTIDVLQLLKMMEESIDRLKITIQELTEISIIQKDTDNNRELISVEEIYNEYIDVHKDKLAKCKLFSPPILMKIKFIFPKRISKPFYTN